MWVGKTRKAIHAPWFAETLNEIYDNERQKMRDGGEEVNQLGNSTEKDAPRQQTTAPHFYRIEPAVPTLRRSVKSRAWKQNRGGASDVDLWPLMECVMEMMDQEVARSQPFMVTRRIQ